jgi:DNA mismatch repair protein MutS
MRRPAPMASAAGLNVRWKEEVMEPGISALQVAQPQVPADQLSVLFPPSYAKTSRGGDGQPHYFRDLNLDQFVAAITANREEYELARFFCTALSDETAISYRQEVFLDLEDQTVFSTLAAFADRMRDMRTHITQSEKLRYPYQAESWLVDAVGM